MPKKYSKEDVLKLIDSIKEISEEQKSEFKELIQSFNDEELKFFVDFLEKSYDEQLKITKDSLAQSHKANYNYHQHKKDLLQKTSHNVKKAVEKTKRDEDQKEIDRIKENI